MLSRKSFTLIEMLLVTSLIAMTGLAVYHSLINGLKIWQASTRYTYEEDAAIWLDKMSQDLRNAVNYSLIKFDGKGKKMSFSTMVRTIADSSYSPEAEYIFQIGRVEYEFDSSKGIVLRRQANYGQAMSNDLDPSRPIASSITDVTFSYYFIEADHIVFKKKTNEQWPMGVLIEVTLAGEGEKPNTMARFVDIPSGNKL